MTGSHNYVSIPYTHDVLASAGLSPFEFGEAAKMAVAANLFAKGRISLGQAAKLCEMGKVEFMEELGRQGYSVVNLQSDDALDELNFVYGG